MGRSASWVENSPEAGRALAIHAAGRDRWLWGGSDFAWHLFPVVEAAVGKRASLAFGYRVLGMDYETSSGSEFFKYDVITSGPIIGMTFRF